MTREDIKTIETIIDYLDRKTRKACFGRMIDLLHKRPDMARHTVTLAAIERGQQRHIHHQLRSYNEQAIAWILDARPDLTRKPEKKKAIKELPLLLRSGS